MNKERKILVDTIRCGHCGNKTLMHLITEGEYQKDISRNDYGDLTVWKVYLLRILLCPNCLNFNIIEYSEERCIFNEDLYDYELDNLDPNYLYPYNKTFADISSKAKNIRDTYTEASTCFKAELYTSSVAMCRKTIEMLCLYFDISEPYTLDGKLLEMRNKAIIDSKLYEWANALKKFGNDAVHTSTKFSKEDAQDILDFTYALVEYCIDFDYKFEKLLQRRGQNKASLSKEENIIEESTINALLPFLEFEELSIRYYVASTLAQKSLELSKVIPVLLSLTDKTKFSSNATNCLKSIGLKVIPELMNALETNTSPHIRSASAVILGEIGMDNHAVIKSLVKALKDSNEEVQYKATLALEKLKLSAVNIFIEIYNRPSA